MPSWGKNGTKWNRRRIAASISAMDRSAVFIVPMIFRLAGRRNGSAGRYRVWTGLFRFSSRYSSSPNTLGRFARLISSITSTNVRSSASYSCGFLGDRDQRAAGPLVGNLPGRGYRGPQPLEEVLVGGGGVELDHRHAVLVAVREAAAASLTARWVFPVPGVIHGT